VQRIRQGPAAREFRTLKPSHGITVLRRVTCNAPYRECLSDQARVAAEGRLSQRPCRWAVQKIVASARCGALAQKNP